MVHFNTIAVTETAARICIIQGGFMFETLSEKQTFPTALVKKNDGCAGVLYSLPPPPPTPPNSDVLIK